MYAKELWNTLSMCTFVTCSPYSILGLYHEVRENVVHSFFASIHLYRKGYNHQLPDCFGIPNRAAPRYASLNTGAGTGTRQSYPMARA